jgi:hypothetical protein
MTKSACGRQGGWVLVAALLAASASDVVPASGRTVSCQNDRGLVGPCFTVHGRLFLASGTPSARILRLGTNRILGVSEHHQAYMPNALEKRLTWDDNVYGDFTVCPFSPSEPGKMQFVCIESASRLILERRGDGMRTLSKLPEASGR